MVCQLKEEILLTTVLQVVVCCSCLMCSDFPAGQAVNLRQAGRSTSTVLNVELCMLSCSSE